MKGIIPISYLFTLLMWTTSVIAQEKKSPKTNKSSEQSSQTPLEQSKSLKINPKSGAKNELNFEDANIEGAVKNPFSSLLNSRDQSFNKGFVKLRRDMHDQMILGISGLSQ